MRGKNIQYNGAKSYIFSPEEATEQNINNLGCTPFTVAVYLELLNVSTPNHPNHFFQYVTDNWGSPEIFAYFHSNEETNEFVMEYYSPTGTDKYKTIKNPTFKEDIVPKLQIGDIMVTEDHGALIYDLVKDNNGKVIDAIIIQSTMGIGRSYVNSKLYAISSGKFTTVINKLFLNSKLNTDIEEGLNEGSIGIKYLSKYYEWAHIDDPSKRWGKYLIFRILNEDKLGNSILNYKNIYSYYPNNFTDNDIIELSNKNKDRSKFKRLFIEKTADKKIVEKGNNLTYKIIIKNRGKEDYNEDLIVREKLSEFVTYNSHNVNKDIINFKEENRTLIWNIGKLKKGDQFIIKYTVNITSGGKKDIRYFSLSFPSLSYLHKL